MDIQNIFDDIRKIDEKKVGLNIKIPLSLKEDFDFVCKANGVSMTSKMLKLIQVAVANGKANGVSND